ASRSPGARRPCPRGARSRPRRARASSRGPSGSSPCSGLLGFFDDHAVLAVVLTEPDGHALAARRGQVLADVVGADRQLAMAAVDQGSELDRLRAPEVDEGVERGADGPAGEEDVVHEDDDLALDREGDVGAADHRRAADAEVVAVERDIEGADRHRGAVDLGDLGREPVGERDAARAEADEGELGGATVLLEDLVGDAGESPVERRLVEYLGLLAEPRCRGAQLLSLRTSRGPLKGKARSNYRHSTRGDPSVSTRAPHARTRSSPRKASAPSIRSAPAPNRTRPIASARGSRPILPRR